ncbi:alpha-1,2-mannosidase, putative [Mariniphaga anaerophila]|uniref:Alpha-1,2-mannosidase, putative n=1 Tax=Mariniphaga anaerophila TaxID=1484053 RepID=A0A1M4SL88_9BACT|nr:GH92 family glycosyl hydrolase [Mariniphaga anaerophila]SHE32747.1 alpha-1,2-mannosidase, putative [Mariniphaga anaerophila]
MQLKTILYLTINIFIIGSFVSCSVQDKQKEPVDYVNPYMGNISHLLVPTYPTVHMPNSMLRVYPERDDFTSDRLRGLPLVVTSHRGSSAFSLSPITNMDKLEPVSLYSYDQEVITPYSYSVYLDDMEVKVDYALSHQSGIYSLEYSGKNQNYLVLRTKNGQLKAESNTVSGYQIIDNGPTKIYIYLETEQEAQEVGVLSDKKLDENENLAKGTDAAIVCNFNENRKINIRYGVSFISTEQAKNNLYREIPDYNITAVKAKGRKIWNDELSKIQVTGADNDDKVVFYTSLYRTYERMINISEDGKYYSAFDQKVHEDQGTPFYTDDWVWDTYRATHPLRTILNSDIEQDMIVSYVRMAQQSPQGWMPTFPEVTGDSHRMNGNHAVAVIFDAWEKGLNNFDLAAAYRACKGALTEKTLLPWKKLPLTVLDVFYHEKGFYPGLAKGQKEYVKEVDAFERRQAISVMLGDCYDSWCLSGIARALNKEDESKAFLERSYNYRNVFNKETSFFHPRDLQGDFIHPFDYKFDSGPGARDYYGENNAWIYRWDVQHNFADLINLMGGTQNFIHNMDEMFNTNLGKSKPEFYSLLPDHTGNVGQFSMANEPCLHIPYLYNYAGQPWKTQKRIRTLLKQWFRNDLMGVPGDEDGGGLSAFVVFSMMGFYPVTPGLPMYVIGSPAFESVSIELAGGKRFEIKCNNYAPENKYIQSLKLNGKEWNKSWISHQDLINGGVLEFSMGAYPNKNWASGAESIPPSLNMPAIN